MVPMFFSRILFHNHKHCGHLRRADLVMRLSPGAGTGPLIFLLSIILLD